MKVFNDDFVKRFCSENVYKFLKEHNVIELPEYTELYTGFGQRFPSSYSVMDAILDLHDEEISIEPWWDPEDDAWKVNIIKTNSYKENPLIYSSKENFYDYLDAVHHALEYITENWEDIIYW